ncbi:transaldolase family protein [Bradyrhizobium sp. STM 3562]|uniref:transaldolase family protein n=1 Tax=Bradyrhizobium sp. STM 3562 TaxID=578924 RepID=UPI0038904B59
MKATQKLHELGQSVWLDNITGDLLTSGTLKRYIAEFSLSGLTSNPTIFDHAIKNSSHYDSAIRSKLNEGKSGETLFFELAIEDLAQAADLFRPIWDRTNGVDGWVSLEVSPLLAHDTASTIAAARELHTQAKRPNLFIKIPGTREGLPAIEESIFAGVPVNVTLLFSREHYLARRRGISARHRAAHCSRSESRCWLRCIGLHQSLGCRRCRQGSRAYTQQARYRNRETNIQGSLRGARFSTLAAYLQRGGGRPQRLLWASTGTKDPAASDVLYIKALAAPLTVNTMPEGTVKALADHGEVGEMLAADGGDAEEVLSQFAKAGVDVDALAATLQDDGAKSFVKSWNELLGVISAKTEVLKKAS